jgi:hypothetical protein
MTNLRNDKLVGEETDSRKHTVGNKWKGCYWVNNGVDVSHPLQKFQPPTVIIPDRTMSAEQNFN